MGVEGLRAGPFDSKRYALLACPELVVSLSNHCRGTQGNPFDSKRYALLAQGERFDKLTAGPFRIRPGTAIRLRYGP